MTASSQDGVYVVGAADGAHERLVDALQPPLQTFGFGGRLRQRRLSGPRFVWGHRSRGIRSEVESSATQGGTISEQARYRLLHTRNARKNISSEAFLGSLLALPLSRRPSSTKIGETTR